MISTLDKTQLSDIMPRAKLHIQDYYKMDKGITITMGWQHDSATKLLEHHARHYIESHSFDEIFEISVDHEIKDAVQRSKNNPAGCCLISAIKQMETVGAVLVDGNEPGKQELGARFRWFFVDQKYSNAGVAPMIIRAAMNFVIESGFHRAYFTTYEGKMAPRSLYRKLGFQMGAPVQSETIGAIGKEEPWVWIKQHLD